MKSSYVEHTFNPVYNENSKILILGTMPSPKSREMGFYYSHPQNRFWRILSDLFKEPIPESNKQKQKFLLSHKIALWDVLSSCEIAGADDGSIQKPVVNDINILLKKSSIKTIFTTGGKAAALYKKYCYPQTKLTAFELPSTSPANCRFYTFEKLTERYKIILEYL